MAGYDMNYYDFESLCGEAGREDFYKKKKFDTFRKKLEVNNVLVKKEAQKIGRVHRKKFFQNRPSIQA